MNENFHLFQQLRTPPSKLTCKVISKNVCVYSQEVLMDKHFVVDIDAINIASLGPDPYIYILIIKIQ